ncbi:molybdopterin dinucleotide binding domain-containing protein [Prauserella oleivorans]
MSNSHPLWLNSLDAARHGVVTDDLVRVNTEIGYFVARVWVTEGIRPGVCALSHHMGRWRLHPGEGSRWTTGMVELSHPDGEHTWLLRHRGASGRSTRPTRTRVASTGPTPAYIRTSRSPCTPTRIPGCTAGCRRSGSSTRTPTTVTATSTSTPGGPRRCTGSGWRRPVPTWDPAASAGPSS